MLLSDWILSKRNEGLTLKAAKWVISNALSIPSQQLTEICRQADHPLMQDETLFDDAPNEVRALFVATPLLPRKYFNGAFSWLFGENSVEEINASSFHNYERLLSQYPGYSIDHKWEKLPFTKDEYDHVYSSFYVENNVNADAIYVKDDFNTDTILGRCLSGLHRHQHISVETFIRLAEQGGHLKLNENASEEVAKLCFSMEVKKNRRKFNHPNSGSRAGIFLSCISALKLKNLTQDMRDTLITTFGIENFKHEEIFRVYNGNIPDSIMTKMFEIGSISLAQHKDLIIDGRIPLEMALKVALYYDDLLCSSYLKRSDVTKDMRLEFLSEMKAKHNLDGRLTYTYINNMTKLIENGVLTLAEIEHFECDELRRHDETTIFKWAIITGNELPTEMQDRWVDSSAVPQRFSKEQLQIYWDIPKIISLISQHYIDGKKGTNPLGSQYEKPKDVIPYLFQNKGWTGELLFELLKVCNKVPGLPFFERVLNRLREGALCRLFSESIYPALTDHPCCDGEGKYGQTEKALAYLLHGNHDMLSQCDIDLLAQSNIQFDYKDDDVDLGQVLSMHPDLNEAIIAEQLKKRLAKIGDDTPTPMTSRKRNHI